MFAFYYDWFPWHIYFNRKDFEIIQIMDFYIELGSKIDDVVTSDMKDE